ncbi:MAG: carboxypeptidase M32 [Candidatus Roizmanbacteria bacterium]|nr:carboxypeptidase M32 [Candidatus Roizmanbacteria bacterium]
MHYTNTRTRKLIEQYREISLLNKTKGLLDWDLNVNLPAKASEARAAQMAQLTALTTDRWLDPQFRSLLEKATEQTDKLNMQEKAMIRNLNWSAKYYHRVPKEVIVEFSKTTSEAFMAWQQAKKDDTFKLFLPHLSKIIRLNQLVAEHLGFTHNPYDALLDQFEQGLTTRQCQTMFDHVRKELKKLLTAIQKSTHYRESIDLVGENRHYSLKRQRQLSQFALKKMGYDLNAGHFAESAHPFTMNIHRLDVRITTWYDRHDPRPSLMATIHEGGHALYEQGISEEYDSTPLDGGVSLGIHESQSRFWENQVGRNPVFLHFLTPVLQAFFPEQLADVHEEEISRLFNHVQPTLTRVEADEVTYNLHLALRFDLEESLINNKIKPKDAAEVWKVKTKEYLGLVPSTDREGVLQDVHWSYGVFGYFPTYTLGNLYAAQFTHAMKKELPLDELLRRGDLGTVLAWLRENIHQYGSLYWPDELVQRVTGEKLNSSYLIKYLNDKYRAIYT